MGWMGKSLSPATQRSKMNKTTLVLSALMLLLGTGCAGMAAGGYGSTYARPLDAHLFVEQGSGGGLIFDVNQPAHVAVFRIVPGRGTVMLYPRAGYSSSDGFTLGGLERVPMSRRGDMYGFLPSPGGYGPEFYLLVASEEPLRSFGAFGNRLDRALGVQFASTSAYSTMEQIVTAAVPNLESGNWTTDFYVHWPETLHHSPRADLVEIRCGDYTAWVPLDNVVEATRALCPQQDQQTPQPSVPGDTTEVVEPIRRPPPQPVTDGIASTQLENPEEWEARRRAAAQGRSISIDDLEDAGVPGVRDRADEDDRFGRRPGLEDRSPVRGAGRASDAPGDRPSSSGDARRRPEPRAEPRSSPAPRSAPSPPVRDNPPAGSPRDNPAL